MAIQHARLQSSALTGASYDDERQQLTISFVGGRTYVFEGVEQQIYDELRDDPSPGNYYNTQIKGKY